MVTVVDKWLEIYREMDKEIEIYKKKDRDMYIYIYIDIQRE